MNRARSLFALTWKSIQVRHGFRTCAKLLMPIIGPNFPQKSVTTRINATSEIT